MFRWVWNVAWYRVLPLVAISIFGVAAATYSFAPASMMRSYYPIRYETYIRRSSAAHNIDPYLVCAVISAESNWNPTVTSQKDARGLMQVMPDTAKEMVERGIVSSRSYRASELDDPATNIEFGCAYLSYLITCFHGSTDLAILAYNAGMEQVRVWAKEDTVLVNAITYPETQTYLLRVKTAQSRYVDLHSDQFAD
ncbi:Lytic transglycosylase catalytic [Coriobacterium glomerans PW2]|uniref:Lytic transglycosylase catalytic n=1 Tax=Coriobacterium glomerans (strain ATCC 49209 / DSM 20642 / JCM 10262 / PW2) TaxID=700015 RepID=F2NBJ6_CORGP|nr:lytic transglycosylase domain-containing protein [Coriobacterium glomerans]AEB06732.1 Lytic transglycosylase catalytic [Coriobacterium glomerans PW2]